MSKGLTGRGFSCWAYGVENSEALLLNSVHWVVRPFCGRRQLPALNYNSPQVPRAVSKNSLAPWWPESTTFMPGRDSLCQHVREMCDETNLKVITWREDKKALYGEIRLVRTLSWIREVGARWRWSNKLSKTGVERRKPPRKDKREADAEGECKCCYWPCRASLSCPLLLPFRPSSTFYMLFKTFIKTFVHWRYCTCPKLSSWVSIKHG